MKCGYIIFCLYLFSYYQLAPAVDFVVTDLLNQNRTSLLSVEELFENNTTEIYATELLESNSTEVGRQLQRERRFFQALFIAVVASIVGGTVSRFLGDEIKKFVFGNRGRRSEDRVSLINSQLNYNYNNAVAFKRKITSLNPRVGNALLVSPRGFQCDEEFCKGKSTGHYALGLCSKHMCYCEPGNTGPLVCGGGLVFNPVGRNCDYPQNLALCGY